MSNAIHSVTVFEGYAMFSFREYVDRRDYMELTLIPPTPDWNPASPPKLFPDDQRKMSRRKIMRLARDVGDWDVDRKAGIATVRRTQGIDRSQMPQLKNREEFLTWLQNDGANILGRPVTVQKVMRTPRSIVKSDDGDKLTGHLQSQIYLKKMIGMIRKNKLLDKLIILTSDNEIFDGNHHWAALRVVLKRYAPDMPVPMYQVSVGSKELLNLIQYYKGVTYETVWLEPLDRYIYRLIFENEE